MNDDDRPDPQDLLNLAEAEDRARASGSLIIFLGYAAGVGKTYAMLTEGLAVRSEGRDIVSGYIETHHRPETDALAARFESVPLKKTGYQGMDLFEPDLEAIIRRRPGVVLIDELAHTDVPGSLHTYRYQDIQDLLQAGISVWTTVNIQHIESLNEQVRQFTGVTVRETVPDTFFSQADEIRLVDLSPEGLIKRLREGKVYVSYLAKEAIERFFARENLLALRQLALRFVAAYSDDRMMQLVKTRQVPGSWPVHERILVAVRPGPNAGNLVRTGYRIAERVGAEWTVMSVTEEGDPGRSSQEERWLHEALETARRLGAGIIRYRGEDVVAEILRYAKRNQITTILMGKPKGINILWSPVYRIIRRSPGIDIILYDPKGTDTPIPLNRQIQVHLREEYVAGVVSVACVTGVNHLLTGIIGPENQLILQLIPVVLTALFFRRDVALVVAVISVVLFDFTFVTPYFTFAISDWQYFISFIGYVIIAFVISTLATRLRHLVPQIWQSEAKVAAVGNLSQKLAEISSSRDVFEVLIEHISHTGPGRFAILTPGRNRMIVRASLGEIRMDEKEKAIAWWVQEHGSPAGKSTDTLSGGSGYYLPMKGNRRVYGVIAFWFDDPDERLSADNKEIYDLIASIGSLALERVIR